MKNRTKTIVGITLFMLGVILMGVALIYAYVPNVYNPCLFSGMLLTGVGSIILYLIALYEQPKSQ